jgi:hypothetical protein
LPAIGVDLSLTLEACVLATGYKKTKHGNFVKGNPVRALCFRLGLPSRLQQISSIPVKIREEVDLRVCESDWFSRRGHGLRATTPGELEEAVKVAVANRSGPTLIECVISRDDCSADLISWGRQVAKANARPAQPQ